MFSKYAWVVPLKDKKSATITNAFQKILDSSKRKLNKILVDQSNGFYSNVFLTKKTLVCIQHIMKENLLLLKDLLEL